MITGAITPDYDALVPLNALGTQGQAVMIDAVVDTGFNGYLTLPPDLVLLLGLVYHGPGYAILADGTQVVLQKYEGRVLWDGRPRDILVLEADGDPLAGMQLLRGNRVILEVVDGGPVTIERLP